MLFLKHSNIIEDFNGNFLVDLLEKKLKISFFLCGGVLEQQCIAENSN